MVSVAKNRMEKIMIKLACKSLDDVPEVLRGICSVAGDVVSLDETKFKTEEDVKRALDAKEHEKSDHKATREKLAMWTALGKSVEDVQSILDEYPALKEGAKSGEDFLNERKAHRATMRELETLKAKYSDAEKQVEELKSYKTSATRSAKWRELRSKLGEKYDADKLDMLYEDIEDRLQLDEIGEFAPYKGKSVEEFFANRAERMGWTIRNTPGTSSPGVNKIPETLPKSPTMNNPFMGESILDDDVVEMLRR